MQIGGEFRNRRAQGELQSIPAPTIYGYLAFLRLYDSLPNANLIDLYNCTLLGNASPSDVEAGRALINNCLGVDVGEELDDVTVGVGL